MACARAVSAAASEPVAELRREAFPGRRDPRPGQNDGRGVLNTGGSSSGTGTTSNFWAANVGTETGGSIIGPSNLNMLAAIKPTIGRISRWGIIPITMDQDTAGPMGKSVTDVAIMLGALEGKQPDSNDPATTRCTPPPNNDYTPHLKADALKGARIGVPRLGDSNDFLIRYALRQAGLEPDRDVSILQIGLNSEILTAMQNGAIEGGALSSPTTVRARRLGYHQAADLGDMGIPYQHTTVNVVR